jgi:copper chaperone CopZ
MTHFIVPDMDCQGCVGAITKAVRRHDASAKVDADLTTHAVDIVSTLDSGALAAAIEAAGYTIEKV